MSASSLPGPALLSALDKPSRTEHRHTPHGVSAKYLMLQQGSHCVRLNSDGAQALTMSGCC